MKRLLLLFLFPALLLTACHTSKVGKAPEGSEETELFPHPPLSSEDEIRLTGLSEADRGVYFNPYKSAMTSILADKCGSCHIASLATSQPAALAIFNLENQEWEREMSMRQILILGNMSKDITDLSDTEQLSVIKFINCELNGNCE